MHGVMRELQAQDIVRGGRRRSPYHVSGVDVLDRGGGADLLKVLDDSALQVGADLSETLVTRSVEPDTRRVEQVLAGAFGHNDDAVALLSDARLNVAQQAVWAFELEGHLGDEAHIHTARRHRRVSRDETRVTAHEVHYTHAVRIRNGLVAGGEDGACRLLDCGAKAEGCIEKRDVIVNRLRHVRDDHLGLASDKLFGKGA